MKHWILVTYIDQVTYSYDLIFFIGCSSGNLQDYPCSKECSWKRSVSGVWEDILVWCVLMSGICFPEEIVLWIRTNSEMYTESCHASKYGLFCKNSYSIPLKHWRCSSIYLFKAYFKEIPHKTIEYRNCNKFDGKKFLCKLDQEFV